MELTAIPQTFGLTVSPGSTHLVAGHGAYHGTVTIAVLGNSHQAVQITMSTIGLQPTGAHCTVPQKAPSWLQLTGARSFTLHGGQDHAVAFTATEQPGVTGSAAVVAAARPAGAVTGTAQIGVSAGSRVTVGTVASCNAKPVTLPAPSGSTQLGDVYLSGIVLAVILALVVALAIRRRVLRSRHG